MPLLKGALFILAVETFQVQRDFNYNFTCSVKNLPDATTRTAMETKEKSHNSKNHKVLRPFSNRTLHHPSFMSVYTNPGMRQCCGDLQTVHPMIHQEFFYTDPMLCGTRIPNHVLELKDFDFFQLNTPPPIMSACLAPTNRPDPFKMGQHLTRNLGSSSWEAGSPLLPVNRMFVVIELTQEEDQAITNLFKLRHGEEKSPKCEMVVDNKRSHSLDRDSNPTNEPLSNGEGARERTAGRLCEHWSDEELEVANTLLTRFQATSEDNDVNLLHGDSLPFVDSNLPAFTDLTVQKSVLSKLEGDALCGLLNLGLAQT